MDRRQMLLATSSLAVSAVGGCLDLDATFETPSSSSIDVEVSFEIAHGDLTLLHRGGDVLQAGQSLYVTVEGDQVTETTLSEDTHTDDEILRVVNAADTYYQPRRVSLYLRRQQDKPQKIATESVPFESSATSIDVVFEYDADREVVVIRGDISGPAELILDGSDLDGSDVDWNAPIAGSGLSGTLTESTTASGRLATVRIQSGESLSLTWSTVDGSYTSQLGSFEAP